MKKVYIAAISPKKVETPVVDGGLVTLTQLIDDGVACVAVVDGSRRAPQIEVIIDSVVDSEGTGKDQGRNQKFISGEGFSPFFSSFRSFPFLIYSSFFSRPRNDLQIQLRYFGKRCYMS